MGARARLGRRRGAGLLTPVGDSRLRRLVLVGAGRANVQLLHALSRRLVRGLEIVLVTPDRELIDPSTAPGLLRGQYELEDVRINVSSLAARAGARVVHASADRLLAEERVVEAGGERLGFDLCVIGEIGPSVDAELPGVSEHALDLRPASRLADVRRVLEERLTHGAEPMSCAVVGAGTTGVECAFALQRMLGERAPGSVVTIVDAAPEILRDAKPCREIARHALEREGVCFALGASVVEVYPDRLRLASGAFLQSDLTIWATGGAPSSLISASGLVHDARGRLVVDDWLRTRDGSPIWAAGDCAATGDEDVDQQTQGELLEREIRRQLSGSARRGARPRTPALCVLDTGDGMAILRWRSLTMRSRLAWRIKRRRDHRFLSRMRGV